MRHLSLSWDRDYVLYFFIFLLLTGVPNCGIIAKLRVLLQADSLLVKREGLEEQVRTIFCYLFIAG